MLFLKKHVLLENRKPHVMEATQPEALLPTGVASQASQKPHNRH